MIHRLIQWSYNQSVMIVQLLNVCISIFRVPEITNVNTVGTGYMVLIVGTSITSDKTKISEALGLCLTVMQCC